jgi:hypothetical protein
MTLKIDVLFDYILYSVEHLKLGVFVEKWNMGYFRVLRISILELLTSGWAYRRLVILFA